MYFVGAVSPVYIFTSASRLSFTKILTTFVKIKITNMNTRLKQFLAAENVTQSQFADTIKVVRASVSHVLSGRNKPGYDFIAAIISAYPHLNIEWLLLGKGKMYKNTVSEESQPKPVNIGSDFPLLFSDYDDLPPAEELPEIPQVHSLPSSENSAQTSNSMNASDNKPQVVVKQRKATKIVIFFDDDTFQEIPAIS